MTDLFSTPNHPNVQDSKLEHVLRLIRSENIGSITFFRLMQFFGSAERALQAIPEMSVKGGRQRPITLANIDAIDKEIEATRLFGAEFLVYGTANYPALLKHISDAPPVLIAKGQKERINRFRSFGVVGSRNASANACRFAHKLAVDLSREEFAVVSGLARGIDSSAHLGGLDGFTAGVIGGGIDTVYPAENKDLYAKMAERGVILTEQPFGAQPQPRHFPARNRIISGMCLGIAVVEATLRSGSLITARVAGEQGRDVFAVPGSPLDPRGKGTNQLLRDGAILCESAQDITQHYAGQPHRFHDSYEAQPALFPSKLPTEAELQEARKILHGKLTHLPVSVDELLHQCQLQTGVAFMVLLELELAGRLQRHAGNRVSLIYEDA